MSIDTAPAAIETLADVVERLGGIPLDRIRFRPVPGTATESDVLEIERRENRLFELVDGVLVEKAVGYRESLLAVAIATYLNQYVLPRNLGLVTGEGGMVRLFPGLVRIPDVAVVLWENIPGGQVPRGSDPRLGTRFGCGGVEPQQHADGNEAKAERVLRRRRASGLDDRS